MCSPNLSYLSLNILYHYISFYLPPPLHTIQIKKMSFNWSQDSQNKYLFHPRCVLINLVHHTDPRFNSFVCVYCKCNREAQTNHNRKPNEEINKKDAKKLNDEKEIEVERTKS